MAKNNLLFRRSVLFCFLASATMARASGPLMYPQIHEVTAFNADVEQYGKFEAAISLSAAFTNPYDYDQVAVTSAFTSPSGEVEAVDGFFMQHYMLDPVTGALGPTGTGGFRVRFSPWETGTWRFTVSVTDANGTAVSEAFSFQCRPVSSLANHGFLRTGQSNYLQFDDGAPYIAIGENIAWPNANPYLDYRNWLGQLTENGGNFFRFWHAHWGLGIEWSAGNGFEGLRRYKQSNCFYQDWLFDYCAANGLYAMLTLQHHGPVSTQVDPNWNASPYNTANGGPCQNTIDFFTHEEARAHTKNRLRYIIARWGYSRSILAWELFNEVHWTDNFEANKDLVAQWHFEMADYLKSTDPNTHLITTSYGDGLADENVWPHPDFGLTQTHIYLDAPNIERVLARGNRLHLDAFAKPTLNGEFGLGGSAGLADEDPDGIHIHNALWGGLFSGGFGTAMSWWWDNYIHPRNLYHHFSGLSLIAGDIPFHEERLAPAGARVSGAPGALVLTPSLGWGQAGEEHLTIDENGEVLPIEAALGYFLYGSEWNTEYRSPPSFSVTYPAEGSFTVATAGEAGVNPRIAIWLDGVLLLHQAAAPHTGYSIDVPAGAHTIRVDNTGTDWITIAAYTFEGLGSQVDAYVLTGAAQQVAAGWALNQRYNHQYVAASGAPEAAPESVVLVEGFQDGAYAVRWYDPLTGALYGGAEAVATGGQLSVPLPSFVWDVAFVVDDTPVAAKEEYRELAFTMYPNPALAGTEVNIGLPVSDPSNPAALLLDMGGREVRQLPMDNGRFRLPAELPEGLYWVQVESGGQVGAQALVVAR